MNKMEIEYVTPIIGMIIIAIMIYVLWRAGKKPVKIV